MDGLIGVDEVCPGVPPIRRCTMCMDRFVVQGPIGMSRPMHYIS